MPAPDPTPTVAAAAEVDVDATPDRSRFGDLGLMLLEHTLLVQRPAAVRAPVRQGGVDDLVDLLGCLPVMRRSVVDARLAAGPFRTPAGWPLRERRGLPFGRTPRRLQFAGQPAAALPLAFQLPAQPNILP